ncbi:MAG: hypothetical protein ABH846_00125 [Patescibacteria group bacterium]
MSEPQRKPQAERSERRESMVEEIDNQLFTFLEAVHVIKEFLKNDPDLTLEDAMSAVKMFGFRDRQEKYFEDGIRELLRRRQNVEESLTAAVENYGEKFGEGLFQERCGFKPKGDVKVLTDYNNLIFACFEPKDFYRITVQPQLEGQPEALIEQVVEEMSTQGASFYGLQKSSNEIYLNIQQFSYVEPGKTPQEMYNITLAHEQQHAENSLFIRKSDKKDENNVLAQAGVDAFVADMEKFRTMEYSEDQHAELLQAQIESAENLLESFEEKMTRFRNRMTESLIKEEILAFGSSVQLPDVGWLASNLEGYAASTKSFNAMLNTWRGSKEENAIGHRGKMKLLAEVNEAITKRVIALQKQMSEINKEFVEQVRLGAEAMFKAEQYGIKEYMMPLLISQKISSWSRLVDKGIVRLGKGELKTAA